MTFSDLQSVLNLPNVFDGQKGGLFLILLTVLCELMVSRLGQTCLESMQRGRKSRSQKANSEAGRREGHSRDKGPRGAEMKQAKWNLDKEGLGWRSSVGGPLLSSSN